MRNVFDRPSRRDRRIDGIAALDVSRLDRGYTPAEHDRAMDRLLADLGLATPTTPSTTPSMTPATPEPPARTIPAGRAVVVRRHHRQDRDEPLAQLTFAGAC